MPPLLIDWLKLKPISVTIHWLCFLLRYQTDYANAVELQSEPRVRPWIRCWSHSGIWFMYVWLPSLSLQCLSRSQPLNPVLRKHTIVLQKKVIERWIVRMQTNTGQVEHSRAERVFRVIDKIFQTRVWEEIWWMMQCWNGFRVFQNCLKISV